MEDFYFECKQCGLKSKQWNKYCPRCGSKNKNIQLSVTENFQPHEFIKGKDKEPGRGKPRMDFQYGEDFSVGRNRFSQKKRVIDRVNNVYEEQVIDFENGEVIRNCKEPLDKHIGHGSDKFKRKK